MIRKGFERARENKCLILKADLVVTGGGLAGVCAAVVAARENLRVVLIQDRPVLGGNASSEVRLWALGATSHMGNNNRWAREGGIINEILLDNLKRNKQGSALIFDTILLEKVYKEKNITLLLNTAVYEVHKSDDRNIKSIKGFCSQNGTAYILEAPFFCDASGDGIVAFQAGASFRMGAEKEDEFDEGFAPNVEDYGELLGHSLYFYTKDIGKPVGYTAPSFAIDKAGELPRIRNFQLHEDGCYLWWVEYGGRLDTVHQSEEIKFELWKVVYGIWDYVKNSGKFPESENLTLEWVGTIPGKRESRRFEGDYMITQKDIVEQRDYYDRVSFGGWAMDLHPADGIYSELSSCTQWHSKGIYSIPYRCFYSKDIENLFLAGRIISATHVAFGSTRVMLTGAQNAHVVGMAASLCIKNNCSPKDLAEKEKIPLLQLALMKQGLSIPRLAIEDTDDLVGKAEISASSELRISAINPSGEWKVLQFSTAQLLPLLAGCSYNFTVKIKASMNTSLTVKLKSSSKASHFTPDVEMQSKTFSLTEGIQEISFSVDKPMDKNRYVYVCFMQNEVVEIPISEERFTGVMATMQKANKAVSNYGMQEPPKGIGIEAFEFWTPERAPDCKNIAMYIEPPIAVYGAAYLKNSYLRPSSDKLTTSWAADLKDAHPKLTLTWESKQSIKRLKLFFDGDFDHPLESIYMPHPHSVVNFVIHDYKIYDDSNNLIHEANGNHQAINHVNFNEPIVTKVMTFVFSKPQAHIPVAVFKISAYS